MSVNEIKDDGRFAITFGEIAVTHIGGDEQGSVIHPTGFTVDQLKSLKTQLESAGCSHVEYHDLKADTLEETHAFAAGVLIIRNGASFLCNDAHAADKLLEEQYQFAVYDRTSFNSRQNCYTNKRSRYNTEFSDGPRVEQNVYGWCVDKPMNKAQREEQRTRTMEPPSSHGSHTICGHRTVDAAMLTKTGDPVFASRKFVLDNARTIEATRNPFSDLPWLSKLRSSIGVWTEKVDPVGKKGTGLLAEGNWYKEHDTKCQIGWHGDSERRIVICLCLGKSSNLLYAWRRPNSSANEAIRTLSLHHGDIYIMSSKATGTDWLRGTPDYPNGRRGWRLVHAAGNVMPVSKKRKLK